MPGFKSDQFFYIRNTTLQDGAYYALRAPYWHTRVRRQRSHHPDTSYVFNCLALKVLGFDLELNGKTEHHTVSTADWSRGKKLLGMVTDARRTPDGSYTCLPQHLIDDLGEPLHLPTLPASLTYTPNENFARGRSHVQKNGHWVDRRGVISCIGSNYRNLVENKGARKALTTRGWRHSLESRKNTEYKVKYVRGDVAARAGNFFLYSQDLNIYNPYTMTEETVRWVGLASCMSIQYLYRHSKAAEIVKELMETSAKGLPVNPFQTFNPNAPEDVRWNEQNWLQMTNQDMSRYANPACPEILETLARVENLFTTPQGIKLQRMEELAEAKKQELDSLKGQLQIAQTEMNLRQEQIKQALEKIKQLREQVQRQREEVPEYADKVETLEPQISVRKRMYAKIEQGVVKKRTQFELAKKKYMEGTDDPTQSTYAQGLARSGLVIDDLIYEHKTQGRTQRASNDPSITVHRDWKLIKAEMHTTRPIKMHFGLEGRKARASGPHKLVAYLRESSPRLQISALVPWAAVGWNGQCFKPYPHVEERCVTTAQEAQYVGAEITDYRADCCLGQLTATAHSAFHSNNPKMLALAVLSYLQSVDPRDEWGRWYQFFPLWDDIEKDLKPSSFEHWQQNTPERNPKKYYVSKCKTAFLEVQLQPTGYCHARWGNLKEVDGQLVEISTNSNSRYFNRNYDNPYYIYDLHSSWQYDPFANVRQEHERTATWAPKYGPGREDDSIPF